MIDQDPIKTDVRRARRQNKLKSANPKCVLCGCPHLEALTGVSSNWLQRNGIEIHHVVGRKRDEEFTVPLCLNCHRRVTEGLAVAGIPMIYESDRNERVAQMLDALAVFFEVLIEALRRWAEMLRERLERGQSNA